MIKFLQDGKEVKYADFGITPVGKTNRLELKLLNEYNDIIELSDEYSLDPEVKIRSYSKIITQNGVGDIVLEFSPSLLRNKSLKLAKLGFKAIIG